MVCSANDNVDSAIVPESWSWRFRVAKKTIVLPWDRLFTYSVSEDIVAMNTYYQQLAVEHSLFMVRRRNRFCAAAMTKQHWQSPSTHSHTTNYHYYNLSLTHLAFWLIEWNSMPRGEVTGTGIRILQDVQVSELFSVLRLTHSGPYRCTISVQLLTRWMLFLGRIIC